MANNPYVNKVQKADGTVLIDISDTTAVASDVASGKYFYTADGAKVEGTGGGGTTTVIIPEQTLTASSAATYITNYRSPLVIGETYLVTVDGTTKELTCVNDGNPTIFYSGEDIQFVYVNGSMIFYLDKSSLYGTYTVKVEQESGGGGSTLITKTITANGTYNAEDDDADGYSSVTVNVSGGTSMNFQVSNTQVRLGNKTALSDTGLTLTVSKTGTYNVYWSAFRSNTSSGYTWGSQLYIGSTAYGSVNTTWSNSYNQINKLTGVSLTKDQVLHVYGQTRSGNSYYICCSNLILEQTA